MFVDPEVFSHRLRSKAFVLILINYLKCVAAKTEMKEFTNKGREATKQGLYENLLGMDAVRMIKLHNLEKELYINALTYLMFLKQKKTGKVKALGCADEQPQQDYIGKEETSSETVSIYVLMACCAINLIENRHVITCDIPGAFLQLD